jgi:L-amino acid N-acyltransferase YncA
MEIEPIRSVDHRELRELELALFKEYLEQSGAATWEEMNPELIDRLGASSEQAFQFYLGTGLSFLAREGERVVGFIFSRVIEYVYGMNRLVWIENMGVDPQFRRQGIGYRLVQRVVQEARRKGAEALVSSIMLDNMESIMLHKKLGFLLEGRKIALLDIESSDF